MNQQPNTIHVLSIEDSPADAALIQELLAEATQLGWNMPCFDVTHVNRLDAALAWLKSDSPIDVVLTDLDLPDSCSDATFATLREATSTLPIVVLTSRDDVALARKTVRAGAEDYLFKREMSGSLLAHTLIYAIERRKDKQALQEANETLEARVKTRTQELRRANAALRESEARFRTLTEAAPVGVNRTALDGRWLYANERLCEITGYTRDELLQLHWQDLTHPGDLDQGHQKTQRLLKGEISSFYLEKRYLRKDETVIWIGLTVSLVRKPTGEPDYFISIVQDITARKEAEQALQESEARERARASELEAIMDAVPAVIWIAQDPACHEVTGNAAAQRLLKMGQDANTSMTPGDGQPAPAHFKLLHNGQEIPPEELPMQQACYQGTITRNYEMKVVLADGTERILFGNTVPLKDDGGQIRGAVAAHVDITARKQMEKALQRNKARYQTLFDESPLPYLIEDASALKAHLETLRRSGITDFDSYLTQHPEEVQRCASLTKILDANQAAIAFYGANEKEALLGTLDKLFSPAAVRSSVKNLFAIAEGRQRRRFETVNQTLDGEEKHIVLEWAVAPGHEQDYSRVLVFVVDITARKEMETILLRERNRLQVLMENFPDTIYFKDRESRFTRVNSAQAEILGVDDPGEVLGKTDFDFFPPAFAQQAYADEQRILGTGDPLINKVEEIVLPNGSTRWVLATKVPFYDESGDVAGIAGVSRDITERKRAEEQLAFHSMLLDQIQDLVTATDLDGRITYVNQAECQAFGKTADEMIGQHIRHYGENPERGATQQEIIETTLAEGEWRGEVVNVTDDGQEILLDCRTQLFHDRQGRPVGMIGISTDITAYKRIEENIRESEMRYRDLFENAPISLWEEDFSAVKAHLDTLRERGVEDFSAYFAEHPRAVETCLALIRFVGFNEATLDLYHAESRTALQQKLDAVLGAKTRPALRQILLAIARGETQAQAETINYTVNGQPINVHIDWRVAPGYEETLEKCYISVKDITALKKTQATLSRINEQLERSNRELDHFAYVASHDLREPLRTVTGFLNLLTQRYGAQLDEKAGEYVAHALSGAQRMRAMINALLDLSRVETRGRPLSPTDSEHVLNRTVDALSTRVEELDAEISYEPLPCVMADAAQLGALFQNLIVNALKFRREGTPPKVHVSAAHVGQRWQFSVRDNGIGIPSNQRERIFQLFQRLHTEEEYPGLGIGLPLCKRIVERHGGRIWVTSEEGQGATFHFTMTTAEAGCSGEKHAPESRERSNHSSESEADHALPRLID